MHRRAFLTWPLGAAVLARTSVATRARPAERFRVGIIGHTGAGNFGHGVDLVWQRVSSTTVVGVADADPTGLATARQRLGGVPGFASYRVMLAETRPDIVAICPRHAHEHRDMIMAALDAGARGLYVEKPFVRTCAEADDVIVRTRRAGARLAVAHRNRYHPALPVLQRRLADGAYGRIIEIRARGKEDQRGGGQDLWVLGGHLFNIATLFTGPPVACSAGIYERGRPATRAHVREGDEGIGRIVGDEIHARFDTTSGVPIFYDSKKGQGSAAAGFGLQVVCEKALVDLRMDVEPLVHVREGSPFAPVPTTQAWVPFTSGGMGVREPQADVSRRLLEHVLAVEDLLEAVRQGREPLCGPEPARETIEMTQSIFASFAAGGRVTLPLAQRTSPLAG